MFFSPETSRNMFAGLETAADLAGNYFFDYGSMGAEFLQDPALMVRGALGNREMAQQYQDNVAARREYFPTFEASESTAQKQEALMQALAAPASKVAQYAQEKAPNLTQSFGEYLDDPSVQTVGNALELFGVPAMRAGRGITKAFKADMAAPSVFDELGGALMARNAPDGSMVAYHGSPHKFDEFKLDRIGTGEGAQAYGHGLYFAEDAKVAGQYRDKLTRSENYVDDELFDSYNPKHMLASILDQEAGDIGEASDFLKMMSTRGGSKSIKESAAESLRLLEEGHRPSVKSIKPEGNFYEVDIPDEQINKMLDWDVPLSEQPKSIKKSLEPIIGYLDSRPITDQAKEKIRSQKITGEELYKYLSGELSIEHKVDIEAAKKLAAEALGIEDIPGIKYLDGTSRSSGEGTRNFVVFDDKSVKTLKRNNEAIGGTQ